jgi:hypothetical protein
MYKILANAQIHSGWSSSFSSEDFFLIYEFELPFVPQIGMTIRDSGKEDTPEFKLDNLTYDLAKNIFVFYEEDKTLYDLQFRQPDEYWPNRKKKLKEIISEWLEFGWKFRNKDDERSFHALKDEEKK